MTTRVATVLLLVSVVPAWTTDNYPTWFAMSSAYENYFMPQINRTIEFVHQVRNMDSLSSSCKMSLKVFADNLSQRQSDAILMMEASSKSWPGMGFDRYIDFGHYRQCLSQTINGKLARYSLIQIGKAHLDSYGKPIDDPWAVKLGQHLSLFPDKLLAFSLCIPSQCDEQDIQQFLNSHVVTEMSNPFKLSLLSSQVSQENSFHVINMISWLSLLVLMSIGFVSLLSYVVTFIMTRISISFEIFPKRMALFLKAFDMDTNMNQLVAPAKSDKDDRLHFYTIFKVAYLCVGSFSHVMLPMNFKTLSIIMPRIRTLHRNNLDVIANLPYAGVVYNQVISSSLAALLVIPFLGKVPVIFILAKRWLRTVPVMIVTMLITMSIPAVFSTSWLYPHGPIFPVVYKHQTMNCAKNGWIQILMLSNFLKLENVCQMTMWFVSLDFQLFVLSLGIMFALKKSLKSGVIVAVIQIVIGCTLHFWYLTANARQPHLLLTTWRDTTTSDGVVTKYMHSVGYIAVYPIGVFLGYALLDTKKRNSFNFLALVAAFFLHVACHIISWSIYDSNGYPIYSDTLGTLWTVLHRPLLAASAAIVFFEVMKLWIIWEVGKNQILQFVARISFSSFLWNEILSTFFQARHDRSMDNDDFLYLFSVGGIFLCGLVGGFLVTIFIEMPASNLIKTFLESGKVSINSEIHRKVNNKEE